MVYKYSASSFAAGIQNARSFIATLSILAVPFCNIAIASLLLLGPFEKAKNN